MAIPKELRSLDLEKTLLAGLIQYPDVYFRVSSFITDKDFTTRLHKFIFKCIASVLDVGGSVSNIIIADKILSFRATFENDISVIDYLDAITLVTVKEEHIVETARRIAVKTYKRNIWKKGQDISEYIKDTQDDTFDDIIKNSDLIYHKDDIYTNTGFNEAENIFENLPDILEELGNNPQEDVGLFGPHDLINRVWGSLCLPGNISIVMSRSGVGKMNPLYTRVLTPSGFCEMREIKVGSKVVCPDGKTVNVIETFDHSQKDIYRVHLSDGRFADCGLEHLWRVWARDRFGKYSWQTVDTEKIISDLKQPSKRVYIPIVSNIHEDKYQYIGLKLPILKVEKLPNKEDCRCIKIDHPEHLYVIDDYIVTHNTQWMMHYGMQLASMHDIPILHLDNGEMSKKELQMRAAASLSGVKPYYIDTGQFRKSEEMLESVRGTYPFMEKTRYFYYNVAGMSTEQILNYVRKFYFSRVGRGAIDKMAVIFDYFKIGNERGSDQNWIKMGDMLIKIKNFISKEVPVGIIAGLQTNRSDISTNKSFKDITEDESVMSLSDLVGQNASHVLHLRKKAAIELLDEDSKFGQYKMLCYKHRSLGKESHLQLNMIPFPDNKLKQFSINFDVQNFNVREAGGAMDVAEYLENKLEVDDEPRYGKNDLSL